MAKTQTLGEYRVGIEFNPSGDDMVGKIKRATADLIDLCETLKTWNAGRDGTVAVAQNERNRCVALAQTAFEDAAMWAVKAATKPQDWHARDHPAG